MNICPCVKIGDQVRYQYGKNDSIGTYTVDGFTCTDLVQGRCSAYKRLALLKMGNIFANPGNLEDIDCSECPIL